MLYSQAIILTDLKKNLITWTKVDCMSIACLARKKYIHVYSFQIYFFALLLNVYTCIPSTSPIKKLFTVLIDNILSPPLLVLLFLACFHFCYIQTCMST